MTEVPRVRPVRAAGPAGDPRLLRATAAVLAVTLLLGGAGDAYPLAGAIVQLGAVLLLALMLAGWGGSGRAAMGPGPLARAGTAIGWAALGLAMLQLVPLPPGLWDAIAGADGGGRRAALAALAATGGGGGWRPLSLDPGFTLETALELLPALAMFHA